ncbi:ankyrin repeat and KH domain-containing protein mask-like isoform X1 [Sipha flava]|uniref:Ankyrin repeat and KH domain-containing protein mask-like isoform X1 n=1 Tax=Sipha flava TaxID=143950 RepID=A0A2S2PWF3_9HEMI|nr:ankyrin repeat and KH domain-containing protein mask-like isoform X1 [Sipha flava]
MASSPLRAPAGSGQPQSRLMDMQKKFQERHLATLAAVKGVVGSTTSSTSSSSTSTGDAPVPPNRRFGVLPQQQQQQPRKIGGGSGPEPDGADSLVQVDVKGKLAQRPAGRVNSKTATLAKKPLATVNGNGANANGLGRVTKKPVAASNGGGYGGRPTGGFGKPAGGGGGNAPTNRLLLPPVVQPTVINALAAGAGAAEAVASVTAAGAAGAQKPLVRAVRLPPGTPGQQQQQPKPMAPRRLTTPPFKPVAAPRQPVAKHVAARPPQPIKPQLSADRGPPAAGMARCPLCSRDFAADRLPKHQEVCQRTRERDRKRKVFDTSRKRLEAVAAEAGVDVSSFKKKSEKEDQRAAEKLKKKKDAWRRKHDQLVRNVRAARAVQRHLAAGGSVRDLPPELENASAPDPDDEADSDLVKCPHCGRSFNEASAERHIPLCADRQRNAAARMQNKKR